MSLILKDTKRKYIMDWNVTDQSIDVLAFGYTQSGVNYSLKYEETYKFNASNSDAGRKVYGSWYDTTTQTTTANTATPMYCNTTGTQSGILKKYGSNYEVQYAGFYNIQFSVQLDQSSGAGHHIYIWFRKNGVDIPYSASEVAIQGSTAETIPSWNFMVDMVAGDYIQIIYKVEDAGVQLKAVAPNAIPGIPSVIVTMWRI